jgi:hypothetical protein
VAGVDWPGFGDRFFWKVSRRFAARKDPHPGPLPSTGEGTSLLPVAYSPTERTECGSANLVIPFNNQHPFLLNQPPPKPTLKGEAKTLLAFFVNFPILLSNLIDGFVQLA